MKSSSIADPSHCSESVDDDDDDDEAADGLDEMEAYLRAMEAQTDTAAPAGKKAKKDVNAEQTGAQNVNQFIVEFAPTSDSMSLVTYRQLSQPPTLRTQRGGIRRCPDYPVWPLGCLPGQSGSGHNLYSLNEIDLTLVN
jgi:hypothetical protein